MKTNANDLAEEAFIESIADNAKSYRNVVPFNPPEDTPPQS